MKIILLSSLLFLTAFLLGACGADATPPPSATKVSTKVGAATPPPPATQAPPENGKGPDNDKEAEPVPFDKRFGASGFIKSPTISGGGCAPELRNFQTFGFVKTPDAQVDFRVITRWEYYSLTPNGFGNLTLDPNLKKFVNSVHHHAGKADLVISKNQFTHERAEASGMDQKLWLVKSVVLVNLIDEIVDAVEVFKFDGVTIDFDYFLNDEETTDSYRFFIKRLSNRLSKQSLQLNVVIPTNLGPKIEKSLEEKDLKPIIADLLSQLHDTQPGLPDDVEFFLVGHQALALTRQAINLLDPLLVTPTEGGKDSLAGLETDRNDSNGEHEAIWNKVVAVTNEDKTSVIKASPGGLGIWNLGKMKDIGKAIKKIDDKGFIEDVIGPAICPNRQIIRWLLISLTAVAGAVLLSAFAFYDMRGVLRKHIRYVIAVLVLILLLFLSLAIADPRFERFQLWTFLPLMIVAIIAMGWQAWDRKNRADYP